MTMAVVVSAVAVAIAVLSGAPAISHQIVVQPGDSALSVAQQEFPEMDPARAVELIEAANGMSTWTVVPGDSLRIPAAQ